MSYLSEKEQIEIFQKWWSDNGTALLLAVLVAVAGFGGWTWWQKHQRQQAEAASALYQDLLDASGSKAQNASAPKDPLALAQQLHKDYSDTFYGQAAALFLAQDAVNKKDLSAAEQLLSEVVHQNPEPAMKFTALLRLAQVLYAEKKYDEAMAKLNITVPESLTSRVFELRGDILLAQGKNNEAVVVYQQAKAAEKGSRSPTLDMKLDNLASTPAAPASK